MKISKRKLPKATSSKLTKAKEKKLVRQMIRKCDAIFSKIILFRDRLAWSGLCPLCGAKNPITQCFHWIPRGQWATRWELKNAIGSCGGCNIKMNFNPHPFMVWFIKHFGLTYYVTLVENSRGMDMPDLATITVIYNSLHKMWSDVEARNGKTGNKG